MGDSSSLASHADILLARHVISAWEVISNRPGPRWLASYHTLKTCMLCYTVFFFNLFLFFGLILFHKT